MKKKRMTWSFDRMHWAVRMLVLGLGSLITIIAMWWAYVIAWALFGG